MKIGDLVRHRSQSHLGVGLIIEPIPSMPWLPGEGPRFAVLFTNPSWTLPSGASVIFKSELEILNESRRTSKV